MSQQLEHKRHTLAHLMAQAVLELYPHAKVTLGPAIDNGFYYDFDFRDGDAPGDADLKQIQKSMKKTPQQVDAVGVKGSIGRRST